jgi:hypothetical protein
MTKLPEPGTNAQGERMSKLPVGSDVPQPPKLDLGRTSGTQFSTGPSGLTPDAGTSVVPKRPTTGLETGMPRGTSLHDQLAEVALEGAQLAGSAVGSAISGVGKGVAGAGGALAGEAERLAEPPETQDGISAYAEFQRKFGGQKGRGV